MSRRYGFIPIFILALSTVPSSVLGQESTGPDIAPFISRYDERIDVLIPKDTPVEILASGFSWSEGPVWIPDGEYILFSDVPENRIYRWSEADGLSVWLEPSGYTGDAESGEGSNGLTLDASGHLILAQHGDRRIARLMSPLDRPEPEFKTLADRWDGKRFNSPNDLVFDSLGNLYFTDPPYGLPDGEDDESREIPFFGVYRLATDGRVSLIDDQRTRPNGIALSPDESVLYVTDTGTAEIIAFDLNEAGEASNRRVFADMSSSEGQNGADGVKIDVHGNVYSTGPDGVHIYTPDGVLLGIINTIVGCANLGWGDDGSTLYITADMYLMRVKTTTVGLAVD